MVWGAVTRIGSRVGSRIADDAALAGGAGLLGGSLFGDVTELSPANLFPGSDGPGGGGGGDGIGGQVILYAFLGIAMLAVVGNLSGGN